MTTPGNNRRLTIDPNHYAFERVQRAIVQQIIDDMPTTMTTTQLAASLGKGPSWVRAQVSRGALAAPKRNGRWAICRNRNRAFLYAHLTQRVERAAQKRQFQK